MNPWAVANLTAKCVCFTVIAPIVVAMVAAEVIGGALLPPNVVAMSSPRWKKDRKK